MKDTNNWIVICTGKILAGFTEKKVIENIQIALSIDFEKAKGMIQGTPTIMEKGIDKNVALQYRSKLEAAGLEAFCKESRLAAKNKGMSPEDSSFKIGGVNSTKKVESTKSNNNLAQPEKFGFGGASSEIEEQAREIAQQQTWNEEAELKKSRRTKFFLFIAFVVAISVIIFILKFKDDKNIGTSPEARAQIAALKKSLDKQKLRANKLLVLLESERYRQLDELFREQNADISFDINSEWAFHKLILDISNKDRVTLPLLNKWVDATGSAYAYLARGSFYVNSGAAARGTKVISQTTEVQLELMNKFYLDAFLDLNKAKILDKTLLSVYAFLISMNTDDDIDNQREILLIEAIATNPAGNEYRAAYMNTITPKLGGSFEKMQQFANEATAYASLNPMLNTLPGYIPAEKGAFALERGNFLECITFYTEALQYGIQEDWLRKRANCLYENGDFKAGVSDMNLFLEYFGKGTDRDQELRDKLNIKSRS